MDIQGKTQQGNFSFAVKKINGFVYSANGKSVYVVQNAERTKTHVLTMDFKEIETFDSSPDEKLFHVENLTIEGKEVANVGRTTMDILQFFAPKPNEDV
jgi:hypothetical protein